MAGRRTKHKANHINGQIITVKVLQHAATSQAWLRGTVTETHILTH